MFPILKTLKASLQERLTVLENELSREREYCWECQVGLWDDAPCSRLVLENSEKQYIETSKALRLIRFLTFG